MISHVIVYFGALRQGVDDLAKNINELEVNKSDENKEKRPTLRTKSVKRSKMSDEDIMIALRKRQSA